LLFNAKKYVNKPTIAADNIGMSKVNI